jgi:hypothetical protein
LKMEPIECSKTSAISTQTPGKHPKENIQATITILNLSVVVDSTIIQLHLIALYN